MYGGECECDIKTIFIPSPTPSPSHPHLQPQDWMWEWDWLYDKEQYRNKKDLIHKNRLLAKMNISISSQYEIIFLT